MTHKILLIEDDILLGMKKSVLSRLYLQENLLFGGIALFFGVYAIYFGVTYISFCRNMEKQLSFLPQI